MLFLYRYVFIYQMLTMYHSLLGAGDKNYYLLRSVCVCMCVKENRGQ